MTYSTAFGDRLRDLRQRRGLTQKALAALAGLSRNTVMNLERGAVPALDTARALAGALGTTLAELIGEEESGGGPRKNAKPT